jgi:predicted DNA-binding transcriptional regulator AlpA
MSQSVSDVLNDGRDRLIRWPDVQKIYPVSRATWWRGVKDGRYPPALKITGRTTVWSELAVFALVEQAKLNLGGVHSSDGGQHPKRGLGQSPKIGKEIAVLGQGV